MLKRHPGIACGLLAGMLIGAVVVMSGFGHQAMGVTEVFDGISQDNVEYWEVVLVPTNAVYNIVWGMPFDTGRSLLKVWAQSDASTCTVSIIEATSNNIWTVFTTNNASIVAQTNGIYDTSFADSTIGAGCKLGVKIENFDTACSNVTVGIKFAL